MTQNNGTVNTNNIILKRKILLENNEIKINLDLSIAKRPKSMITDTGANLTILNKNVIKEGTLYCPEMKCTFTGINGINHKLSTEGLTCGHFQINDFELKHDIQVIDNTIKLNGDGILGVDFLKKYGAKINLIDDEIEFNILQTNNLSEKENKDLTDLINLSDSPQNGNSEELNKIGKSFKKTEEKEIELKTKKKNKNYYENMLFAEKTEFSEEIKELKINKIQLSTDVDKSINSIKNTGYLLPPRSFNIFQVQTNEDKVMLCNEKELEKNVFILEGLIESKNGKANIELINENDTPRKINLNDFTASVEDINNHHIYFYKNIDENTKEKRIKYLKEKLPMNHLNEEEKVMSIS